MSEGGSTQDPYLFVFFSLFFVASAVASVVLCFGFASAAAPKSAKQAKDAKDKASTKKAKGDASSASGSASSLSSGSHRLLFTAVVVALWAVTAYLFVQIQQGTPDLGFNPYAILGVPRHAPAGDISKAYRQLSRVHHPDRLLGLSAKERAESEAMFKLVSKAYEALTKEDAMKNFELYGHPDGPRRGMAMFRIADGKLAEQWSWCAPVRGQARAPDRSEAGAVRR